MLPGFRFLFAAIILSMSVLVFGLGAAALLRAAHEQFASIPSRRPPPEPVFAKANEPPMPTLALLRFEPPAEKAPDIVSDNAVTGFPEPVAPARQTLDVTPAEPEKLAALKPEESAPAEPAKAEVAIAETLPVIGGAPTSVTPTPTDEVKLAAIADVVDKHTIPMVKITVGQRIDMLCVRKEQLPNVWRDLNEACLVSGHAYGKALRTVKTCVCSEWCRFGVQDSTAM